MEPRPSHEEVAHHEAAHVIVAWVLGELPLTVTIFDEDAMESMFNNGKGVLLYGVANICHDDEALPLICLAGYAAEKVLSVAPPWDVFKERLGDYPMALKVAQKFFKRRAEEFLAGYAMKLTDSIVSAHWRLIERLAKALLERRHFAPLDLDFFLRETHRAELEQLSLAPLIADDRED